MDYSIAFFSETPFQPATKISRLDKNMRTDLAWMCALDADCYNLNSNSIISEVKKYDIAMVIIPKYNFYIQLFLLENFDKFKKRFKKTVWVQEGPADLIHDFDIKHQFQYLELMKKFDLILCHSWKDQDYFKFLSEGVETETIPTLMITDLIKDLHKPKKLDRDKKIKVIVSGNIGNWYHGLDAFVAVKELSKEYNIETFCVTMGRKDPAEQYYTGYKYIPYVEWYDWMRLLKNMDVGINMTRRTAANTFNMNCEYLGIPVLRTVDLETNGAFGVTYYSSFKEVFGEIIDSYEEISKDSVKGYSLFYSEDVFLKHMNKIFSNLLTGEK